MVLADRPPLPGELEAFLDSGDSPVLVGFGSMPAAERVSRPLIGAARAVGRRVLLSKGWAGLKPIDDAADCFGLGDVSHELLFRKVAAVVHHGGVGTTMAAARAGVPQVVAPRFGDQFYWASRVVQLGIGTATPHSTMTEESLSGALQHVLNPAVTARARLRGAGPSRRCRDRRAPAGSGALVTAPRR
jgi:vancomycin aglycone glucosyltransferase